MESKFIHGDCMDYLKDYPDDYFDLCIADPPYGDARGGKQIGLENGSIGIHRGGGTENRSTISVHYQRKNCRQPDGTWGYANWRNMGEKIRKKIITWDIAPDDSFFKEIFRVSRNQIIWGGNYFSLPPTRCFIIWRKLTISENFSMAMAEYAWTSFNDNAKVYEHVPQDASGERFHPTQKPLDLYLWLLNRYAKDGDKILDPMCGSANSLIACHRTGHEFVGFEIDDYYYEKAKARLDTEMSQKTIFDLME